MTQNAGLGRTLRHDGGRAITRSGAGLSMLSCRMSTVRRVVWWLSVGSLVLGLIAAISVFASQATELSQVPKLGSMASGAGVPRDADAVGWGTYEPRKLFNGGDPSGLVFHISWKDWGRNTAYGTGLTYIPRPTGGYYGRPVLALLRASDLGHCAATGPLTYEVLDFRGPTRPGGPLLPWGNWSYFRTVCNWPPH